MCITHTHTHTHTRTHTHTDNSTVCLWRRNEKFLLKISCLSDKTFSSRNCDCVDQQCSCFLYSSYSFFVNKNLTLNFVWLCPDFSDVSFAFIHISDKFSCCLQSLQTHQTLTRFNIFISEYSLQTNAFNLRFVSVRTDCTHVFKCSVFYTHELIMMIC